MAFTQPTYADIYGDIQTELQDTTATTLVLIKICIHRIYRRLQNKISRIDRDYYLTSADAAIVADTQEYNIVDDWSITDMKEFVMLKDENANRIYKGDLRKNRYGYYFVGRKKVGFIDTPTASKTYTFYYLQQQANLSGTTDTPNIPLGYEDIFTEGGCWLYWRIKKEKAKAAEYKALYLGMETEMLEEVAGDESREPEEVVRTEEQDGEEQM